MTQTANPLLAPSSLPNHAPPFDRIAEAHYLPAVQAAIDEARNAIRAIKENASPPDFANTIAALETSAETLGYVTGVFYNQLAVAETPAMEQLAQEIGPLTSDFSSDIAHDPALFARVKAVYDACDRDGLTAEQRMLLDETYKGFVREGALLDEGGKARLREISSRLSVLGPQFGSNVTKATEAYSLVLTNENDLAGLPESARAGARAAAEDKGLQGQWVFTLHAPSYGPFLQFSERRDLRERMWRAYGGRCWNDPQDNSALILEIVRLRHERAKLLGYPTHAHYVLEKRMAERPETVMAFLDEMKAAYRGAAAADLDALRTFAREKDGIDEIQPWDVAYYGEKLREAQHAYSSEEMRPYLPLEQVLEGVFTHFSKLFNLRFTENPACPGWHAEVKAWDVHDLTSQEFVGTLYTDFHPRTGKRGGAWKTAYRNQGLFHGRIERPVVAIVCNFTRPTADAPALLSTDEVRTLLHEMGHATHALLSRVTYASLAGTSVLWDFVELPSQLQENWAYARETVDLFARHHKTGAKVPQDLHERRLKARTFMTGWAGLRQMIFAGLDLSWHGQDPAGIHDVAAFEDAAVAGLSPFPRLAGPFSSTFSHIFAGGYSAGYYSYKWAEVLEADVFALFAERGVYDRATAEALKNEILSKGGTEHPAILYRRFRGRDADPGALLRKEGIAA